MWFLDSVAGSSKDPTKEAGEKQNGNLKFLCIL